MFDYFEVYRLSQAIRVSTLSIVTSLNYVKLLVWTKRDGLVPGSMQSFYPKVHASLEEDGTVTFQGDSDALISKGRSQVLWMEPARAPWKSQHLETCDWMRLVQQSLDHSCPFATWFLVRETWQFFLNRDEPIRGWCTVHVQPVREGYFLDCMRCRCLFAVSCRSLGRLGCFARPVFERLHS